MQSRLIPLNVPLNPKVPPPLPTWKPAVLAAVGPRRTAETLADVRGMVRNFQIWNP